MHSGEGTSQLTAACAWFIEEEKKTEDTINHLRRVMGSLRADSDATYNFLNGYLAGIRTMFRTEEKLSRPIEK